MNKKDLCWFLILFLILSINSAEILFRKQQIIWGNLSIILGIIFLFLALTFYFISKKEKDTKSRISLVKKIVIIILSFFISTILLNYLVPEKPRINKKEVERRIQILLSEQERLTQEMEEFQNQGKLQEAIEQISHIKEKTEKTLVLNQILFDHSSPDQKNAFLKRKQILETSLAIFSKMEKCFAFYPQEVDSFNHCQQEVKEMTKTVVPNNKQ